MLLRVQIEHEVRQRALQLRAHVPIDRKAPAGDLHGALEIQNAQLLAELPMRLRSEAELARCAPAAHFLVVGLRSSHRHRVVRQVGDAVQDLAQFGIRGFRHLLALFDLPAQILRLFDLRRRVLFILLELRDLIRRAIALRLQILGFGDRRAPTRIDLAKITQQVVGIRAALPQLLFHQFQMITDKIQIEHRNNYCIEKCGDFEILREAYDTDGRLIHHRDTEAKRFKNEDLD